MPFLVDVFEVLFLWKQCSILSSADYFFKHEWKKYVQFRTYSLVQIPSSCHSPHMLPCILWPTYSRRIFRDVWQAVYNPEWALLETWSLTWASQMAPKHSWVVSPKRRMREKRKLRISSTNTSAAMRNLSNVNPNPKSVCYFGPLKLGILDGLSALISLQGN